VDSKVSFCRRVSGEEEGHTAQQIPTISLEETKAGFEEWRQNGAEERCEPDFRGVYAWNGII
jgi:hypothetical protein